MSESKTTDIWLAAICCYLYGDDALWLIEDSDGNSRFTFTLAVPECDLDIIATDYRTGQCNLADAKAFTTAYNYVLKCLRKMRERRETSWTSLSWVTAKKVKLIR
jgi:hypothetical protein